MVDLITIMPPPEADQKRGYKFPFVVSELLSCEAPPVIDNFFTQTELLHRLYKFLDQEELNYTLSGYFSKFSIVLINRNPAEMLKFLFDSGYSLSLLKHVYNRSISELVLKVLYVSENSELFLTERLRLFTSLLDKILSPDNAEASFNCVNILCEILNRGLENRIVTLIAKYLMQRSVLDRFFEKIFLEQDYSRDSSLLFLKNLLSNCSLSEFVKLKPGEEKPAEVSEEEDSNVCMGQEEIDQQEALTTCILQNLGKIQTALKQPCSDAIPSTFGEKIEVLTRYKLDLIELLNSVVRMNSREVLMQIAGFNVIEIVVDLFFTYKWNSLLHNLFENLVLNILNSDCLEVHNNLLNSTRLLEKLVSSGLNPTYQNS